MQAETSAAVQTRSLRQFKLIAGAILLAAAGCWALTFVLPMPPSFAGYVRAAAEAGIVGGLADWFAVTALFRRPLGLPIPHTALIPNNQRRIADGVARYIDGEFLRRDMLVGQLRRIDVAERVGKLLDNAENRARLVDGLMRFLPKLLTGGRDHEFRRALTAVARDALSEADFRPTASRLLRVVIDSDDFPILIREALAHARSILRSRREWFLQQVGQGAPWYVPRLLSKSVADKIFDALFVHLSRLEDPESDEGRAFRDWLRSLPAALAEGGEGSDQIFAALKRIAADPEVMNIAASLFSDLRLIMIDDLRAPQSKIRVALEAGIASLASQFENVTLRRDINATVESFMAENIPSWRDQIRKFITQTLEQQHPEDFTRRIELQVGRDLQFIRINGTVIGALIGILIHLTGDLLGG